MVHRIVNQVPAEAVDLEDRAVASGSLTIPLWARDSIEALRQRFGSG